MSEQGVGDLFLESPQQHAEGVLLDLTAMQWHSASNLMWYRHLHDDQTTLSLTHSTNLQDFLDELLLIPPVRLDSSILTASA